MSEKSDALVELARRRSSGEMTEDQAAAFDELRSRGVFTGEKKEKQAAVLDQAVLDRIKGYGTFQLGRDVPEDMKRRAAQYAGSAVESGIAPPVVLAAAGGAVGGAPGFLAGLGIGTVGEIPAMLTGKKNWSPTAFITDKLRQLEATPEPDPEAQFGRKVAGYVGSSLAAPGIGGIGMGKSLASGLTAGTGAATANEIFPGNPYAEMTGAMAPSAIGALGKAGIDALRPSHRLAYKAELPQVVGDPQRKILVQEGKKLQKEFGGQLSASERGLGEGVRAAEGEVAGAFPESSAVRSENNLTGIIGWVKKIAGGTTAETASQALAGKTVAKIASLKSSRVPEFEAALDRAAMLDKAKRTIDTTPVKQGIVSEIKSMRQAKNLGQADKATITYLRRQLKRLPSKGAFDIRSVQSWLHDYTVEAKPSGGILTDVQKASQKRGANLMKGFMEDALDKAGESGISPGAVVLKEARVKYAKTMNDLAEVGATPLGAVIEKATKKRGPLTVKDIQSAWSRSTPEQRGIITELLGNDKQIIKSLQGSWADDLIAKSTSPISSEVGRSGVDLRSLLKNWKEDKNFTNLFADDKERLGKLLRVRAYMDRIVPRGPEKATQGVVGKDVELARTATGLSTGHGGSTIFLGGFLTRKLLPGAYKKLLTTDEGIDALLKAAEPKKYTGPEVAAAVTYLQALQEQ